MPKPLLELLNASNSFDFFVKLGLWFAAIVVPLYDIFWAIFSLIVVDFVTGYRASFKKKERFSWPKVWNSMNKVVFYTSVVFAGWIIESKIIPGIPFMRLVAGFLALTELRSILFNFKVIFGIDVWDYIRAAIQRKSIKEVEKKEQ